MFENSDQRFLRALESQKELEKRLKLLRLNRKVRVIFCACGFVGAIVMLIISSRIAQGMGQEVSIYVMLPSVMLLFFPLIFLIQVCHTHSQIRTLLVFQKLKGP
jgi:hypothetical protein